MTNFLLLVYALGCHFGFMLAMYNAANATGLPRKLVKTASKAMAIWTLVLPMFALWQICDMSSHQWNVPTWVQRYALAVGIVGTGLIVRWVLARPGIEATQIRVARNIDWFHCGDHTDRPLARTRKCKWLGALPMNQIFDLSIEKIDLPVVGLPEELDGFRLAHLSDIHLTGHIDPALATLASQHAMAFAPDLVALTGDIIDHADCIEWLPQIFGKLAAKHGCHYVLGNHDKRHGNTDATRAAMNRLGWNNVGGRSQATELAGVASEIIGNESPWYPKPVVEPETDRFRLLLSHSPDQIEWARRHHVTLMLAGHTHGGQGRLPVIGPLIAPSRYGTRFASGDFYLPPTTMHVTRGISGTHLLRINCRPEVSLLTLRMG